MRAVSRALKLSNFNGFSIHSWFVTFTLNSFVSDCGFDSICVYNVAARHTSSYALNILLFFTLIHMFSVQNSYDLYMLLLYNLYWVRRYLLFLKFSMTATVLAVQRICTYALAYGFVIPAEIWCTRHILTICTCSYHVCTSCTCCFCSLTHSISYHFFPFLSLFLINVFFLFFQNGFRNTWINCYVTTNDVIVTNTTLLTENPKQTDL